jgi:hypothetical protein
VPADPNSGAKKDLMMQSTEEDERMNIVTENDLINIAHENKETASAIFAQVLSKLYLFPIEYFAFFPLFYICRKYDFMQQFFEI